MRSLGICDLFRRHRPHANRAVHHAALQHTTNDMYWADGGDGTGRNQLGKTLVQVRQMIREGQAPEEADARKEARKETSHEVPKEAPKKARKEAQKGTRK